MAPLATRHYFRRIAGCHFSSSQLELSLLDFASSVVGCAYACCPRQRREAGVRHAPRLCSGMVERHHLLCRLLLLGVSRDVDVWRVECPGRCRGAGSLLPLRGAGTWVVWRAAYVCGFTPKLGTARANSCCPVSVGGYGILPRTRVRLSMGPAGHGTRGQHPAVAYSQRYGGVRTVL